MIAINSNPLDIESISKFDFKIDCSLGSKDVNITWCFDDMKEMVYLYMVVKHLRENYFMYQMTLTLPYIPFSYGSYENFDYKRVSEVNTLKQFCRFINELKFDSVYVIDFTRTEAIGMLNNVFIDRENINYLFIEEAVIRISVLEKIDAIVFVNEEEYFQWKRVLKDFSHFPSIFYRHTYKDSKDRIKDKFFSEKFGDTLENKNILVIENYCRPDSAFYSTIKKLEEKKVNSICGFAIHCCNNIDKNKFLTMAFEEKNFKKLYVTDSLYTKYNKKISVLHKYRVPAKE